MARPNYSFAKKQREIVKKQKKEAKRLRKAELKDQKEGLSPAPTALPGATPPAPPLA